MTLLPGPPKKEQRREARQRREEKTSEMRRMILEGKDVLSEGPDKDAYDALWKDLEEKRPAEIVPLINRDRPSDV